MSGTKSIGAMVLGASMLLGTAAWADPNPNATTTLGEGTPPAALPPPRSDNDPQPPVAAPTVPQTGVTKQAGVGGTQAYGRAGVLELGGSAGFSAASDFTRFEIAPSVGLFVVDNLELSLIGALNHISIDASGDRAGDKLTEFKALVEPSYHIPFSDTAFAFLGLGGGLSYVTGSNAGFALQPRLGGNFLVGRSGVLTPSLTLAYSTVDTFRAPDGTRLVGIKTSYGMNVGYTVMW